MAVDFLIGEAVHFKPFHSYKNAADYHHKSVRNHPPNVPKLKFLDKCASFKVSVDEPGMFLRFFQNPPTLSFSFATEACPISDLGSPFFADAVRISL